MTDVDPPPSGQSALGIWRRCFHLTHVVQLSCRD